VAGLASVVTAIAAGVAHTCALTSGGGVKCWGNNYSGQLGDGTTTDRHTSVGVAGLASGVTAIAAGAYHNCALTSAGRVACWGWNDSGQLGDGTRTDRLTPVGVVGFEGSLKCIVPNGIGKPLAKAKVRIVRAYCRVGRVTRVASRKRKGTVVGESPRPGKRLKKGAKVSLKVSRGR